MAEVPVESRRSSSLARTGTPDVWQTFRNEMDRAFDRFGGSFGFPSLRRMFDMEPMWRSDGGSGLSAPIDVSEDEKSYRICAELPGLEAKDVDVSVYGDRLVLQAEKHQEQQHKDHNFHVSERSWGSFRRAFELPQGIERDKISADFSKGLLTITLPKNEQAQKRSRRSRSNRADPARPRHLSFYRNPFRGAGVIREPVGGAEPPGCAPSRSPDRR